MKWKPARTGDPLINRNFDDLATKLSGIDDVLQALDLPDVSRVVGDFTFNDEDFVDYAGAGGHTIKLPSADRNGPSRATVVYVANNGKSAISVRAQGRNAINGLSRVSVAAGSMLLAASNGVDSWQALVTTTPVARAGHIIQDTGVDKTQRNHLDFVGFTVTDDAVHDRTTITAPAGTTAGHIIQDNGTNKTQRGHLDFIGFKSVTDNAGADRTEVTSQLAGHIIQDHEVDQTQRDHLDFSTGAAITDDSGNDATKVAIRFPDYDGIYDSAAWYGAPTVIDPVAATIALSVSATSGNANFLYAYPVYFSIDGTIKKIAARHSGGTGSGGCKQWQAIYSADTGNAAPKTRLADFEQVSTGFGSHSETTINLAVKAGTILWFATVLNANEASNGYVNVGMEMMRPVLGTNYDGAGGTDFTFRMGFRVSFTYGQPPSTWSGSTKLLRASSGQVPAILYTFLPS